MNTRPVTIYTLADPRDGQIRYVGKTVNMEERLINHMKHNAATSGNPEKQAWITELRTQGKIPVMEPVEEFQESDEAWKEAEGFWIGYFRFLGFRLLNLDSGWVGCARSGRALKAIDWTGRKHRPETIAKMRKPKSPEHIAKMRARKLSPEHVEFLRNRKMSLSARLILSEKAKQRYKEGKMTHLKQFQNKENICPAM